MSARKMRVCVVTPASKFTLVGQLGLSNLIKVLKPLSDSIFVITGELKDYILSIKSYEDKRIMVKTFKYIISQLKLSLKLFEISSQVDAVILFWGTSLLFPLLAAKMLRKKVILGVMGSSSESLRLIYMWKGGLLFYFIARIIAKINYSLCDRIEIAMQSKTFINYLKLEKQRRKIVPLGEYFMDSSLFKIRKKMGERGNIVGYAGRLSREEGVLQFAKAIPFILSQKDDLRFLIVGNGPLMADMKEELEKNECIDKVDFTGWVPYEKIPDYFNEMRIHVLPSYTEAFGGTAIEAMACGAISVANSVGGISDIIIHGKTGFLAESNNVDSFVHYVKLLLNDEDSSRELGRNAYEHTKEKFNWNVITKEYENIYEKVWEK